MGQVKGKMYGKTVPKQNDEHFEVLLRGGA